MVRVQLPSLFLVGVLGLAASANATPITFSGGDAGANDTDPRPVSNATAASFDAAAALLGTEHLITFESSPVGTYSSLVVAPGVTLTGTDFTGNSSGQSILNAPFGSPDSLFGYNTTAAGANYAFVNGNFITFSFATPIDAFGAYLSGVQLNGETVMFNDGSSQSVAIPNLGSGVEFVGFTDSGHLISSIEINTASTSSPLGDFVGVDDVRYVNAGQSTAPVPEPTSLLLLGTGIAGLVARRRRQAR
jgi:hypothetical protein